MIRLVNKEEEYRICANCPNAVMKKLPGLNGVWICEVCSGFEYRLPAGRPY